MMFAVETTEFTQTKQTANNGNISKKQQDFLSLLCSEDCLGLLIHHQAILLTS